MADKLLPVIGVDVSARGVGEHYGARTRGGLIDGWLVDESDASDVQSLSVAGLRAAAVPLFMRDRETTRALAERTLDLAMTEHVG
jgi:LPPG:FO 2-phospho-L-lactate transferase